MFPRSGREAGGILLQHGHPDALLLGNPLCLRIPGICVPHNSRSWVCGKYAFEPLLGVRASVGDEAHSCVYAVAHPDSSAVVYAHPCRACCRVQEGVQNRPVSNRIATIHHSLRFSPWRSNTSRVEMVPADPDWTTQLAITHHVVDYATEL